MEKMNCDIIKDLIPSYVDEVCTDATKQCVEEHMRECDKCRQMVLFCKNNVLSEEKLEQKELDGFKKIRKIMRLQDLACYLLLAFMIFLGVMIFAVNRYVFVVYSNSTILYILCMLTNLLTCIGHKTKKSPGKTEWILGAVSFTIDLYLVFIIFYLAKKLTAGAETVFGLEPIKCGPFLERQLIFFFILQITFFIFNLVGILKQEKNCNWLLGLNIMGVFLTLEYDIWMKMMASPETLMSSVTLITIKILGIGVLGMAASILLSKFFKINLP